MTYVVALTGGIGSGKSTIANYFAKLGVPVIDADIVARVAVAKNSPALAQITQHFGIHILEKDGSLNRKALREIIFNNAQQRLWLNNLLHPIIAEMTKQQINAINAPYVLWVVPLLIENKLQKQADRILVIDVDPQVQLKRVTLRDNIDEKLAQKMLSSQISNKERLKYADDTIQNNNQIEVLLPIIEQLHRKYITLANTKSRAT